MTNTLLCYSMTVFILFLFHKKSKNLSYKYLARIWYISKQENLKSM